MIKAQLHLPNKQVITVHLKNRHYKKIAIKLEKFTFWQKIKILFSKGV